MDEMWRRKIRKKEELRRERKEKIEVQGCVLPFSFQTYCALQLWLQSMPQIQYYPQH